MLGSRVVLGWVMVVGVIVGLPIAAVSPGPETLEPSTLALLGLAGICYVVGLQLTYAALRIGKVSIVAPIVATEGAVAALIAVALGDPIGIVAGLMLAVIAAGVVAVHPRTRPGGCARRRLRHRRPTPSTARDRDGRAAPRRPRRPSARSTPDEPRCCRSSAALVFGVGLVAAGKSAALVPVAWVALSARLVGIVVVVIPLLMQRRLRRDPRGACRSSSSRASREVFGSMLSAWGSRDSIAIAAVMGSQFAAIAAVAAYFLFGERLGRLQVAGVVADRRRRDGAGGRHGLTGYTAAS